MERKMKYIINYTEEGKILGFAKGNTNLNKEVFNDVWFEAQSFNKIIIAGDNISFDKVDWRTDAEIRTAEINTQIAEAKEYLASTDFYMTVDKYAELDEARKVELTTKRAEARELISTLEAELGAM